MKILTLAQKRIQGLSSDEAQEGFSKDISVQMLNIKVKRKIKWCSGKEQGVPECEHGLLEKRFIPKCEYGLIEGRLFLVIFIIVTHRILVGFEAIIFKERVAWAPKWDLRVVSMHWIGLEQILDHKGFRGNLDVFTVNKNIACLRLPENVQGKEWSPSRGHINSGLKPGSLPFQHKLYVWGEYYLHVDNFHRKLFIVLEFLLLGGREAVVRFWDKARFSFYVCSWFPCLSLLLQCGTQSVKEHMPSALTERLH